jgi:NADH:ubiquinone oxidoreductase subunit 2 (subunit N)
MSIISADFYFYSVMAFLFLSTLPFLMTWASNEKKSPFYFQSESAYYYTSFVLLLALLLSVNSIQYKDIISDSLFPIIHNKDLLINPVLSKVGVISNQVFISMARVFIILISLIAIVLSYNYLSSVRLNYFEFYLFVLYSTLGSLILVSSNHALLTYLAIELQSLSLYLLASSQRKSIHSIESGIKYMFIGSLASGALLLGLANIYMLTGSLDFSEIRMVLKGIYQVLIQENYASSIEDIIGSIIFIYFGAALIILALLIKMAAAPFHMWLADVYEGAPTSATIYFLLVPKISVLVVFYRVTHELFSWDYLSFYDNFTPSFFAFISPALYFPIIYSFIIGYIGILSPKITLKRFFAFSSIGHVGFLLLPFIYNDKVSNLDLSIFKSPMEAVNFLERQFNEGALLVNSTYDFSTYTTFYSLGIYLLLYVFLSIPSIRAMLLFTSPFVKKTVGRRVNYTIENLPSLFHVISPANGLYIFMLFITFVGIPPTVGFFMKLVPLAISIHNPNVITFLMWPIILLSSYVYVRVLVILFFKDFDITKPRLWSPINGTEGYLSTWFSVSSLLFLATYAYQSGYLESLLLDVYLADFFKDGD